MMWPEAQHLDGVLFDLDDTLLDHRGAARNALIQWAPATRIETTLEVLEAHWMTLESIYYQRYQAGELTRAGQRRARIQALLPELANDDAAAEAEFERYWTAYQRSCRAFDDAREALLQMKARGLMVGVLTNGSLQDQRRKMENTGLASVGVPLIASSELPAAKPDARAFHVACEMLGVTPSRCLMIGDSIENDARGAQAAGLVTLLLDRNDRYSGAPFPRVRSLREVVTLLA